MSFKMLFAAASIAALAAPAALAEPVPDNAAPQQHAWHMASPEQMAQWHAQMCKDRYAHEAGRLAYLQAALSITDAQRGAFEQWRNAVLSAASAHSEACLARTADGQHMHHDALERNARMEKMLEGKLAELKSERPALEALYSSLTPEQKKEFDRAEHGSFGHHRHMGEHFGEHHDGWQQRAPG